MTDRLFGIPVRVDPLLPEDGRGLVITPEMVNRSMHRVGNLIRNKIYHMEDEMEYKKAWLLPPDEAMRKGDDAIPVGFAVTYSDKELRTYIGKPVSVYGKADDGLFDIVADGKGWRVPEKWLKFEQEKPTPEHADEMADLAEANRDFAALCLRKLYRKAATGWGGWDDATSRLPLQHQLRRCVDCLLVGDTKQAVDVANLAMFLERLG